MHARRARRRRCLLRAQLASLAVATGQLDEARALLRESVDAKEDAELSTQALTFSLVARAELALAQADPRAAALALGAANGLRQRIGLRAWPSMRRREPVLLAGVVGRLGSDATEQALAEGSRIDRADAIALVRNGVVNAPIPSP